jgi:hypothetical protein
MRDALRHTLERIDLMLRIRAHDANYSAHGSTIREFMP